MANSNNMSTNHNPFHPQSHPQNSQFTNIPSHYQLPMHNIQMGLPQPQFFPQNLAYNPLCQPQGQFFMNNHPQVMNMPGGQFNFHHLPQHLNQISGLPHGQFPQHLMGFPQVNPFNASLSMHPAMGCVNQGAQLPGSQNMGFQMNPQSGVMNSHPVGQNAQSQNALIPSTMGQNALLKPPITSQQLQRNPLSSVNNCPTQMQQTQNNFPSNNLGQPQIQMQQTQNSFPSNNLGKSQGNHANYNVSNMPNTNQRNPQGNFTRNQQESAKNDPRSTRFQKFTVQTNAKGNFKSFKGRGSKDKGARNPQLARCAKQETIVETKRTLRLNYTAEEIKKWRDERRRHHPYRPKIVKNSQNEAVVKNEVQKRRQQLKEILAKQAELGVEVAEIPREYQLDSEKQVNESGQKRRLKKCGGRRQQRRGPNKKQKTGEGEGPNPKPALIKRSPTLLQKLLGADIKREKSHLLQAFRFMVLNNFFMDLAKKPLEIPAVIVKDMPLGTEDEPTNGNDEDVIGVEEDGDSILEGSSEEEEEGELTD